MKDLNVKIFKIKKLYDFGVRKDFLNKLQKLHP